MSSRLFLGLIFGAAASGATLFISPETVYTCSNGLGRVTVSWSRAGGPVEVRVGSPRGVSMTGLTGPQGNATSGDWVTDGMTFFLVNQQGGVEAQATARVRCGESAPRPGNYFPLQVGNQWVYRINSRTVTSDYTTRTITGAEEIGGLTYYTIANDAGLVLARLRSDSDGRILDSSGGLMLDPAAAARTTYAGPLGVFSDAAQVTTSGLAADERIYVRAIGLVRSESRLIAGSSGGFASGLELVEARLNGGIRLAIPVPQLSLSVENTVLDVTGRKATNCAVPSYCVACGLIGADPPGTYKPCAQARVEGRVGVEIELLNALGQTMFRAPVTQSPLRYVQLPLYSKPNEPLPPGLYTLVAKVKGEAEASLVVKVE